MTGQTAVDAVIGGILMPQIIAVIVQSHWSPKLKGLVALAACLAAGAVTEEIRGTLHWGSWRDTTVVIAGSALALHHVLWQTSGIAQAIEAATTLGGPRPAPQPVSGSVS